MTHHRPRSRGAWTAARKERPDLGVRCWWHLLTAGLLPVIYGRDPDLTASLMAQVPGRYPAGNCSGPGAIRALLVSYHGHRPQPHRVPHRTKLRPQAWVSQHTSPVQGSLLLFLEQHPSPMPTSVHWRLFVTQQRHIKREAWTCVASSGRPTPPHHALYTLVGAAPVHRLFWQQRVPRCHAGPLASSKWCCL